MTYSIDLTKISIKEYKELLLKQNLLPGRRILLENIEERFSNLQDSGAFNVAELKSNLSTSLKLKKFSEKTCIPEEYLIILRRELGSLEQKPVAIQDFPDLDEAFVQELMRLGMNTSKDYFLDSSSKVDQSQNSIMLFSLCDLVRINGVGVAAARTFYEAGYRSAIDVANANAFEMLTKVNEVNEVKQYYKARLGEKDMQFCIDFAKLLTRYEN